MAVDLVATMRAQGMSDASLDQPATVRATLEHVSVLAAAIKVLQERVAEVEAKGVHYDGTWQRASEYTRGSITTHKGCAWACVADCTRAEPDAGPDWQLMVKAGRDAR